MTLVRNAAAHAERRAAIGHVCLAGKRVSGDWSLIGSLKRENQVTIVERPGALEQSAVLEGVDVLVFEMSSAAPSVELLRCLRRRHPGLCIVLMDRGAPQNEIAAAFREGVLDCFPSQSSPNLLVERIQHLCRRVRSRVAAGT